MKKFLSLLMAGLMLFSCAGAGAEETQVVATFYPVYIFARNILLDVPGVSLSSMTPPSTGCLHDYQLLTGDMRLLSHADVLLINGAGMETFLPDILAQLPDLPVVDASAGIALLCGEEGHHHEHEHDHDHGEYNAHIWLAPENAIQMVQNMADQLASLLPAHSQQIARNADAYIQRLAQLHTTLKTALQPYEGRKMVTFHDSFPYFAKAYGLEIAAVVSLEPDEALSPRMMMDVIEAVEEAGKPPLFAEPQYKNAPLELIGQETGAPVYLLNPIVTGEDTLTAYEDAQLENLETLLQAFSE